MNQKYRILIGCVLMATFLLLSACAGKNKELYDLSPMLMLEGVLYYDTGVEEPMGDSSAVNGKIVSTVAATEKPTEHGQSNFGGVGNNYSYHDGSVVVYLNDTWIRFKKETLTLEQITRLAEKGEVLTWEDFAPYDSYDVGSGTYILLYEVDENYNLLISGGDKKQLPMNIFLVKTDDSDSYIDIRKDDVDSFISKQKED